MLVFKRYQLHSLDIKKILGKYILPLEPLRTDIDIDYQKITNIKAVIFDIYGTLLISAAGEISVHEKISGESKIVITKSFINLPDNFSFKDSFYKNVNKAHIAEKEKGIKFPEINVLKIWDSILKPYAINKEILNSTQWDSFLKYISINFELINNPVWLMPAAADILIKLNENSFRLGIISNAQFYTPIIMEYLLESKKLNDVGFSEELCIWSWMEGRGKPDSYLFEKAATNAENLGIARNEILYIGNDMYNDIFAGKQAGFRTCLFAGDKRSLRMRSDKNECMNLEADLIINNLNQISDILELK